jgi:hypothetical protein
VIDRNSIFRVRTFLFLKNKKIWRTLVHTAPRSVVANGRRVHVVSNPFNVQHNIHVNFDSKTGFDGLPAEWEVLLSGSGITVDDVRSNPESALEVLAFEAKRQDIATAGVQFEKADGSIVPLTSSGVALADTADGPAGDSATSVAAPAGFASTSSTSSTTSSSAGASSTSTPTTAARSAAAAANNNNNNNNNNSNGVVLPTDAEDEAEAPAVDEYPEAVTLTLSKGAFFIFRRFVWHRVCVVALARCAICEIIFFR